MLWKEKWWNSVFSGRLLSLSVVPYWRWQEVWLWGSHVFRQGSKSGPTSVALLPWKGTFMWGDPSWSMWNLEYRKLGWTSLNMRMKIMLFYNDYILAISPLKFIASILKLLCAMRVILRTTLWSSLLSSCQSCGGIKEEEDYYYKGGDEENLLSWRNNVVTHDHTPCSYL